MVCGRVIGKPRRSQRLVPFPESSCCVILIFDVLASAPVRSPLFVVLALSSCVTDAKSPAAIGDCAARADASDGSDPWIDCIEDFAPAADATFGHDLLPDIVRGPPGGTLITSTTWKVTNV